MQAVKSSQRTQSQLIDLRRRIAAARGPGQRDAVMFDLVKVFRKEADPEVWQLILTELGQALEARVNRFRTSSSPLYSRDDLAQEMVIALHETALSIPLPSDRHLERRLVLRTANRVSRLLKREWTKQQLQDPLDVLEPDEEEEFDES